MINVKEIELKIENLIIRERIFDFVCYTIGKIGRIFSHTKISPIFIIGTGRCGTSLLVKILNTNSSLSGFPGEANELWHPRLEPFETTSINIPPIEIDPKIFSDISLANWPSKQRGRVRDIFLGFQLISGLSKLIFTKSAMVSFIIPRILEIFPNARFIHIYRYGPSVVESYFKKNFGKYSRYVYTEKDYRRYCAQYWNACIIEIEERQKELLLEEKGQFFEFSYESLCQNPKDVLDKLASFIGVEETSFKFDISKISSQNFKAVDFIKTPDADEMVKIMSSGLKLKGYLA